jgi:hypothetical protein
MTSPNPPPTPPGAGDGETLATFLIARCPEVYFDAYFATKDVIETNGTTRVCLERIRTHVLGRVLYVVVEGLAIRSGTNVTITLRTNDTRLTGVANQALRVTNGTADVENFTVRVGDTSALNDNAGVCAYSNLAEFTRKAIFKISLRPHSRDTFDAWAQRIRAAGQNLPSIRIEVSSPGIDAIANLTARFTPLTLENKKVYEIYHANNTYNFLRRRGRISHIENDYTNDVKYYFFNRIDNCHMVYEATQSRVRRRADGTRIAAVPRGHIASGPAPGGDARMNYYYNRTPRDTTTQPQHSQYFRIVTDGNYGVRQYVLADPDNPNDMVDLIRMPDNLNYDRETGANRVWATFGYVNTQRRSCNPGCFAGFLGVLITLGRNDINCTGICFDDATSYPSVTHPNGDSVDTAYLPTQREEQAKIDAFNDHYFRVVRRGDGRPDRRPHGPSWLGRLGNSIFSPDHETHLHAEDFDGGRIDVLNQR